MPFVFGPVPSRRLGCSLGLDVIPFKTCTLDCVYCQLGPTAAATLQRAAWVTSADLIAELRLKLPGCGQVDYITFSGSGEPTLNSELGDMIDAVHALCDYPVAVITNGTLMHLPEVRRDLGRADLVVPSLDAATPEVFKKINRPHPDLQLQESIDGLVKFRDEYAGRLWVEVMVVPGFNDDDRELERLAAVIRAVRPDAVQINSPCRPAAEPGIVPADRSVLMRARDLFGEHAEIIGGFTLDPGAAPYGDTDQAIIDIVTRHPSPLLQISSMLGLSREEAQRRLSALVSAGRLHEKLHNGIRFYSI